MTWNIDEFYKLAQQRLPQPDISSLELRLRSLRWKFFLCHYHKKQASRILSETFRLPKELELVEAIGKVLKKAAGTDEGGEFAEACLCAEANAIAFAQSLHSASDILAQVLCISLKLGVSEKERYLSTVVQYMTKHAVAPSVVKAAKCVLQSDEFRYLRAYVNTIKHVSLVGSGYVIGLVPGQEKHGLEFAAFTWDSQNWPQKCVADFIGADFDRLSSMIGTIGTELTAFIRNRPR